MRKVQIIIIAAAGLASFAGVFGFTWYMKQQLATAAAAIAAAPQEDPTQAVGPYGQTESPGARGGNPLKATLHEEELKDLIFEVRERITEYKSKERSLAEEAQRIETAKKSLDADVERLSVLHDALNVAIGRLKQQEAALQRRLVEISALEKQNLQRIASTYDKMDVTQASTIIVNMASNQQLEDAVKIIYLMGERTAAKLLGEISTKKPDLASLLSTELKKVKESE
ncbi:MAG: hypothetical protein IH624_00365 [Phycisphaerae bacterium]|nr:hypothetical protein [Phycisphaerae bacterium]